MDDFSFQICILFFWVLGDVVLFFSFQNNVVIYNLEIKLQQIRWFFVFSGIVFKCIVLFLRVIKIFGIFNNVLFISLLFVILKMVNRMDCLIVYCIWGLWRFGYLCLQFFMRILMNFIEFVIRFGIAVYLGFYIYEGGFLFFLMGLLIVIGRLCGLFLLQTLSMFSFMFREYKMGYYIYFFIIFLCC